MPALFRIVQDDCPPIPEGCSPIVKDFLYHCFQKDSNLRISGKKLLRHPWMLSTRKQMANGRNENGSKGLGQGAGPAGETRSRKTSNYGYDEAVLKVQEWNEALRCTCLRLLFIYKLLTSRFHQLRRNQRSQRRGMLDRSLRFNTALQYLALMGLQSRLLLLCWPVLSHITPHLPHHLLGISKLPSLLQA